MVAGLIAGLLAALGCGGGQDTVTVGLGEEAVLAIDGSARVVGEDLEIVFVAVTDDSRCARDVTCIWEGRVVAAVEIALGGVTQSLDLVQPGLADPAGSDDQPTSVEFRGYRFSFAVEPYPETAGVPILESEYRLHLIVTR